MPSEPRVVRVVFDTNVLLSALIREHSTPADALKITFEFSMLYVSEETLAEFQEVAFVPSSIATLRTMLNAETSSWQIY